MNTEIVEKLVGFFWDSIAGVSKEEWHTTSSADKERIAEEAVKELGLNMDLAEVYEIFWEWADGLESTDFEPSGED